MNVCAAQERAQADQRLNRLYVDYKKRLTQAQAQQLKQAQLAWIQFRDASCVFESSGVEGGSAHPMVHLGCLTAKTQDRIKALEALSACEEGDLSCPAPK